MKRGSLATGATSAFAGATMVLGLLFMFTDLVGLGLCVFVIGLALLGLVAMMGGFKRPPKAERPSRAEGALPAPGWYAYPEMAGTQRYWDGTDWSGPPAPGLPPRKEDNSGLVATGVVTALLLPFVGLIIGIVLAAKSDKWGVRIIFGSVGAFIFWYYQLQPDPEPAYVPYGY